MVETKDLPTGLLFSGASGTGKTTLARIVASKLDADVIEVDAASHGGVADVRKLNDSLRYSGGKEYRILIIDEAHSLTREAFNALLKSLEEPPEGVMYILITTNPNKLPDTVRTRLVEFSFRPLTPSDIVRRLVTVIKAEDLQISADLVKYFAMNSEGSLRKALTDLGQVASSGISSLEEFLSVTQEVDHSVDILQDIIDGEMNDMYMKFDASLETASSPQLVVDQIVHTLRDLMIIKAGGETSSITTQLPEKIELARRLHSELLFALIRVLWDLKTQIRSKGDSKIDAELALALMFDMTAKTR
jgi:DNA polymerase-3 subunit gamma/tau